MGKVSAAISCLLLAVGVVTSQKAPGDGHVLPQWLTGLIAVVVFLFLSFVGFLVNRAWCAESRITEEAVTKIEDATNGAVRSKDQEDAYDVEIDSGEEKDTVM